VERICNIEAGLWLNYLKNRSSTFEARLFMRIEDDLSGIMNNEKEDLY
jgi:hypothetical protein